MNTPWRVSETDNSRVSILGTDGRVMTEIIPGQRDGKPVSQDERLLVARLIAASVNIMMAHTNFASAVNTGIPSP